MAITTVAPVAPTGMVTKVLDTYRETGLGGGPITPELLVRMSMGDEIARRVLQTLRLLDYIDDDGNPTKSFLAFKQASTASYKQLFADQLYDIYAPVFAVTGKNLAGKTVTDVEDAFRRYSPGSLRKRMVTLFLGLCQYAGVAETVPTRKPGPKQPANGAPPKTPRTRRTHVPPPPADDPVDFTGLDDAVVAWIKKMPKRSEPWSTKAKDRWFAALRAIVDGVWESEEN